MKAPTYQTSTFDNTSDFANRLSLITGTINRGSGVQLIGPTFVVSADRPATYINSGIGLTGELNTERLDFDQMKKGGADFFLMGERFDPTRLWMPEKYHKNGPHCHPGGEIAVVLKGSYQDVDLEGNVLREYGEGDVIFYQAGSTHRPVSDEGSQIFYIPFNGIVFGDSHKDLLTKLATKDNLTSEIGLEYALHWMLPDPEERQTFLAELE